MLFRPELEKAYRSMLVTLEGIVTLDMLEHHENAKSPMLVTLEGIVMLVRAEQP